MLYQINVLLKKKNRFPYLNFFFYYERNKMSCSYNNCSFGGHIVYNKFALKENKEHLV